VNVALPLPAVADCAAVIQATPLAALHPHADALAATVTVSVPPAAETAALGNATVKRHGAASCATATCASLTPTIALRGAGSAFAATRYVTLPLPCPAACDVIATHDAPLVAVQVQSRVVSTAIVPVAPSAGTDGSELAADTWHFGVLGAVTAIDDDPQADERSAITAASAASGAQRVMADERVPIPGLRAIANRLPDATGDAVLRYDWTVSCPTHSHRHLDRSRVTATCSL
jgi:hypothetical protein